MWNPRGYCGRPDPTCGEGAWSASQGQRLQDFAAMPVQLFFIARIIAQPYTALSRCRASRAECATPRASLLLVYRNHSRNVSACVVGGCVDIAT